MSENKIVKYMFYVGVFTVTMIYYIFAAFVLEKAFFENIEYISNLNIAISKCVFKNDKNYKPEKIEILPG